MESLPDALVQSIMSEICSAKDLAACNCVSKRWKDSTPYIRSLFFPRASFDKGPMVACSSDEIVLKMVASVVKLEDLVVYCPFSGAGLASWLFHCGMSLRHLELRMDTLDASPTSSDPLKTDCIGTARNLESLKLWNVLMTESPKWDVFENLRDLQIVGATLDDHALSAALRACPNLTRFLLLASNGLLGISVDLPKLQECKLDVNGAGDCSLSLSSSKLESLEIQGFSWISVRETDRLRNLSISNANHRVYMVDFGKLGSLEVLSIRGIQWCWDAISKMLHWASEVKHLYMKVEFTGESETLLPFPEIDFVDFFNGHPKLQKFDIHGAMFAALCQKNSLKNVDLKFVIPCLEDAAITVRSPLNAEQKMSTLESLVKYGKNLKRMVVKILQMKSSHSSADDFFEEICRFSHINRTIVRIE